VIFILKKNFVKLNRALLPRFNCSSQCRIEVRFRLVQKNMEMGFRANVKEAKSRPETTSWARDLLNIIELKSFALFP
jgi:hypothetical protein